MKYYVIAGEASGDLHGSNLIRELKRKDPGAVFRCWGGDKMQEAGGEMVKHYRDLAFMGFAEVLLNLGTILRNLKFCKQDILEQQPDALLLIDYPGFNLRIAQWAKTKGIRVIFYISPQVWAWKENRVHGMRKCIDKLIVILPFEKEYYRKRWNWDVEYYGHPLAYHINTFKASAAPVAAKEQPVIALLPGSRKQEIRKKLPVMLEVTRAYPAYRFVVAKAPGMDEHFYDDMLRDFPNVSYVSNKTYPLLMEAKAALVTSGTATLEVALFGVPEVVCYKASWLSYQVGKRLVRVKYISLVNLILDKPAVTELIQHNCTPEKVKAALQELLSDTGTKEKLEKDYSELQQLLGTGNNPAEGAAASIHRFVSGAI